MALQLGKGRAEMLTSMDSRELSGWLVLMNVKHHEHEREREKARMAADSDDGQVIELNKPPSEFDDDDEDDEITDGQAE